jgi:hypothetical protein
MNRKGYFVDYHHHMKNMEAQQIIIQLNEVEVLDDISAY